MTFTRQGRAFAREPAGITTAASATIRLRSWTGMMSPCTAVDVTVIPVRRSPQLTTDHQGALNCSLSTDLGTAPLTRQSVLRSN
jgi:hypothetical protein